MLAPDREPADMDWDGYHDFGVSGGLPSFGVCIPSLDPLPLGSAVLEPYFHLDLAEFEGMCDLGALRKGQVLLTVELLLQLQELFAGEGRSSSSVLASRGAVTGRIGVLGTLLWGVFFFMGRLAGDVII